MYSHIPKVICRTEIRSIIYYIRVQMSFLECLTDFFYCLYFINIMFYYLVVDYFYIEAYFKRKIIVDTLGNNCIYRLALRGEF